MKFLRVWQIILANWISAMHDHFLKLRSIAKDIQKDIDVWELQFSDTAMISINKSTSSAFNTNQQYKINDSLKKLAIELSNSYIQIYEDLQDTDRISWAGTAHEIREILTNLLRLLAPDEIIIKEPWYKQVKNSSGPTQKQRVKYILVNRGAGSKEQGVVGKVTVLDEMIEDLVRSTYKRASDAAHRYKTKSEVSRILRYFETFAVDLLDLDI